MSWRVNHSGEAVPAGHPCVADPDVGDSDVLEAADGFRAELDGVGAGRELAQRWPRSINDEREAGAEATVSRRPSVCGA